MLIGHKQHIADFKKLADEDRLAHGYIFFGPRRVGKATFARALGNYLETKAFEVPEANAILGDLMVLVPTAGEPAVGIGHVRSAKTFLAQAPNRSSRRMLIVDGAEHLTTEAENALLKTTEEPYPRALIILVIDDPERLLPTLRSRLQKVFFGAVPESEIATWLTKGGVPTAKASGAVRGSWGSPGLAWAYMHDERFKNTEHQVREFLRTSGFARSTLLKELVQDETFRIDEFLEILAMRWAMDPSWLRKHLGFWHRIMELRRNADSFNLNPRLQLTALAQHL